MADSPLSVAVVGAGNMGSNHIRVYDELAQSELVAVVEPDPELAAEIRNEYGVAVVDSVDDLSDVQAATISVPTELHREIATACLDSGIDILVEKPLAGTVEDANAIVERANEADAILQVGHIERYNPVVEALEDILSDSDIVAFDIHRLGPFSEQLSQENVLLDLMIHDLDVITHLIDSDIIEMNAIGRAARSATIDHAICQLAFDNGVVGSVTASHTTHDKVREFTISTSERYIHVDYFKQEMSIKRWGATDPTDVGVHGGYRTESILESPFIQTREPLKNEIEHFLDCVGTRSRPRTDGVSGCEAVKLACAIESEISIQT